VAEEEKQLLSVRDPIREREAYCSSQRERELLISFLNLLFSGREWDMFFCVYVCVTSWAKMKEKEYPLDHHNG